jgi:hypothetical protein
VLLGRRASVRRRVANVLLATTGVCAAGLLLGYLGSTAGLWDWPPRSSSPFGVGLGFAAALIVYFEMAIWPRKWLRGWRMFGRARFWMWAHIWVGLVGLPVVVLHSGFAFGGPLAAWTFALFLAVIASGVYGLVLQQWLPHKIQHDVPNETVASEIDRAIGPHVREAERTVDSLIDLPAELDEMISGGAAARVVAARGGGVVTAVAKTTGLQPVVVGSAKDTLTAFHRELLRPYLQSGRRSGSPLASRAESQRLFTRLRGGLPDAAHPAVRRLEDLADLRRQWDTHARMNRWLHGWLLVHLPLSVAMTILMTVHAVKALKYW